MNPEYLQAFCIGAGAGACIAVGLMLHWHARRVRQLWVLWFGDERETS